MKHLRNLKRNRPRRKKCPRQLKCVDTDDKHGGEQTQLIQINPAPRLPRAARETIPEPLCPYLCDSSCVISSHVTPFSAISTIM